MNNNIVRYCVQREGKEYGSKEGKDGEREKTREKRLRSITLCDEKKTDGKMLKYILLCCENKIK